MNDNNFDSNDSFEPANDWTPPTPPPTVEDVINPRVKINRAAYAAIRDFRRTKTWQGTFEERLAEFNALAAALSAAYGIDPALKIVFHGEENRDRMSDDIFDAQGNAIHLIGRLSVVTFLHVFGRARSQTREEAVAWSLSVFKRMFPVSYSRCHADGLLLIR